MKKRVRDYKKEYEWQGTEEQKKRRAQRNKDRRKALREGKVTKGDSKEIHHVDHNPHNHSSSNVKIIPKSKNRRMQDKK